MNYNITYSAAFYNSMIYRTFIGYNGTDIGFSPGIPGLPGGAVQSEPIEPGWMLAALPGGLPDRLLLCLFPAIGPSGCYHATNLPTAQALAKAQNGSIDSSGGSYIESGGEAMLEVLPRPDDDRDRLPPERSARRQRPGHGRRRVGDPP